MEGATIGTYRVLQKLGEGGMGAVYVAEHTLLGRKAAIKVLLPTLSASQSIVQRFFNEARAVTSIADPGIVQVFDFGYHTDGSAYIVMELLEGETMAQRLARVGRYHPVDALRLIRQAAASLGAAHAKGIVHRDLKPENIFIVGDPAVTGGERPKILDFGIAKLSGTAPGTLRTQTGALMGTPVYMSPEQCRGAGDIDHRSDIYSLGCVLFCMVTGRPPFEGEGAGEIIAAHMREPPPLASTLAPGIPAALDAVIGKMLEKPAAARYPSMADLAIAIGQAEAAIMHTVAMPYVGYVTPAQLGAYPTAPPPTTTPTTLGNAAGARPTGAGVVPSKRRGPWIAAAVVGAFGVGAISFFVLGGEKGASNDGAAGGTASPPRAIVAIDAGVAPVVAITPDAGAAAIIAPLPIDAGTRITHGTHHQQGDDHHGAHQHAGSGSGTGAGSASGSGSGGVDRGD